MIHPEEHEAVTVKQILRARPVRLVDGRNGLKQPNIQLSVQFKKDHPKSPDTFYIISPMRYKFNKKYILVAITFF
jgi:hypothetical protein